MVFKFIKKVFSDAPVDQMPNGATSSKITSSNGQKTQVTEEATESFLNSTKLPDNMEKKTLTQEKWIELLHTFVDCKFFSFCKNYFNFFFYFFNSTQAGQDNCQRFK